MSPAHSIAVLGIAALASVSMAFGHHAGHTLEVSPTDAAAHGFERIGFGVDLRGTAMIAALFPTPEWLATPSGPPGGTLLV